MERSMIYNLQKSICWNDICNEFVLMNVLAGMKYSIGICDAKGIMIYVNYNYEKEQSVVFDEILGKSIYDVAPNSVMRQVMDTGQIIERQCYRIIRKNLDIMVYLCMPIFAEDNALLGAISIFKTISQIEKQKKKVDLGLNANASLDHDNEDIFNSIIGKNYDLRKNVSLCRKASKSEITVLLDGETGTGKELFARAIHYASKRRNNSFVEINCAAIPENLLESELFGYESGSFTGAHKGGKIGKIEMADKGTLFLDEIGELSLALQAKLLRVLQERKMERIGGAKSIHLDIRIIAATNKDLKKQVAENKFRADLFFRLNVLNIHMVPLRNMKDDIPLLSSHFLEKYSRRENRNTNFTKSVLEYLMSYDWPGNIRELQNVIESCVVSCEQELVEIEDLPQYMKFYETNYKTKINELSLLSADCRTPVSHLERELIIKSLRIESNNCSRAAKMLGMSRTTLYNKLIKYGIKVQRESSLMIYIFILIGLQFSELSFNL